MTPSSEPDPKTLDGARVLVAGGGAYVAGRLIPRLSALGAEVAAQARHPERVHARASRVVPGALDETRTQLEIREFAPEVVFGLAGRTDQSHSRDNDDAMAVEHFGFARGLARAVIGPELRRWVHAGSNEEYGNNPVPFSEDQREDPVTPYSVGKTAATHYLKMLAGYERVPVCIVRPFVIYGPCQERGLIPFLCRMALEDEEFDTTEGRQTRDFVHVDDVVDGLLAAAVAEGVEGEIINLGTGVETPVRRVVELVCEHGGGGRPRFGARPMRESESLRCVSSTEKAARLLGWRAATGLSPGLKSVVEAARESAARA